MVMLLSFLALGVDFGYLRYVKRQMQEAADAAALAGAMELSHCGGTGNCSALTTAAQDAVTENGFPSSTLVINCGTSSAAFTITVNNPPCSLGTADPHRGDTKYVETVVARSTPVFFARIFGSSSVTVTARGEAALGNSSNCLYALAPTASNALSVTGGSTLQLPSCSMFIDSSSSQAVIVSGGSPLPASSIAIVGGFTNSGGSSISPRPRTGAASASDPLAYVPKPSFTSCPSKTAPTTVSSGSTKALSPGSYCGGIVINGGSTVTFAAGTYVVGGGIQISNGSTVTFGSGMYIMEGGGFPVSGGSTVTGSGVTFYLTGDTLYPYQPVTISNGSTVQLIAPTSGTYVGMLFYQDASAYGITSSSTSSFTGGTTNFLQGSLYFPTTSLVYSNGASAQYTNIVAASITISGGVTLNSNYSSLSGGSPIKGTGGVLVE